jgi:D-aminopeptidase
LPALSFDERRVDAVFAELDQCQLPGAMAGVAINGRPVYRKGFGLANMELPLVLAPTLRSRIGSTSKHFTCLAYMLLCEEGKASMDEPLGKVMPELHPVAHAVTARQLMGNTSGLLDSYDLMYQFSGLGERVTSEDLVAYYEDIATVNAPPGTAWIYNNGGFELLRVLIERISGQRFERFMSERIFQPLGMYDTLVHRSWGGDFVPNRAAAHMAGPRGSFEKWTWSEIVGAGGILSTVDDMLRWLTHMDQPVVGSRSTWAMMQTPQTLANGSATAYGLGLMLGSYRGVEMIYHGGGGCGSNAQMLKLPALGLDIVVLVNRSDVWSTLLANRIMDVCISGLAPTPDSSKQILAAGVFRSPRTHRVVELFAREGQQIAAVGGNDLPVAADERGVLWPTGVAAYMKQSFTLLGDRARPDSVLLNDCGSLDEMVRVAPCTKPDITPLPARYRSAETGSEVQLAATEHGLNMSTWGRYGSMQYDVDCLAHGVWRARSPTMSALPWVGGILAFEPDGQAFHYSTTQMWALHFRRCG